MSIKENYQKIKDSIPPYVTIVVAAKTRSKEEINELIDAGATDIGQNYVQEAENIIKLLGDKARKVKWHMIGHLQKNKINKALPIFDIIQTVDSVKQVQEIDKRVEKAGKSNIPVLIEINIGSEFSKEGIKPSEHEPFENFMQQFVVELSKFKHVQIKGLMTMGPRFEKTKKSRPFFRRTQQIFNQLKNMNLSEVCMKYLSMGMTNSYHVAIEEGSNMIRVGTAIFGERESA
jgi:hypothetical protein